MTRTLYIHAGVHRTATTSIQSFLRTNFSALQKKGVFNPFAAGRHFGLVNKIFSGESDVGEVAADITARADGKRFPIDTVILSDEDICCRRNLSPLARFQDHFDVKVVFSMRRQDLWLESWHQQNVKWQWNPELAHLTFPEFLKRRQDFFWIDYARTLRHLEELFGAEALRLIVFEKDQMPGGPVETFARAIGLDTAGLPPAPHTNPSLTPQMSEFMRTLPLDELDGPQRRLVEQACARIDHARRAAGASGSTLLMDWKTRRAILDEFAASNAAVAARYFDRDVLFHDPLPAPDAPIAEQSLPADSYETMRDFVGPMLRDMMRQLTEQDETAETAQPGKKRRS
jgi:hypothetical protein